MMVNHLLQDIQSGPVYNTKPLPLMSYGITSSKINLVRLSNTVAPVDEDEFRKPVILTIPISM